MLDDVLDRVFSPRTHCVTENTRLSEHPNEKRPFRLLACTHAPTSLGFMLCDGSEIGSASQIARGGFPGHLFERSGIGSHTAALFPVVSGGFDHQFGRYFCKFVYFIISNTRKL